MGIRELMSPAAETVEIVFTVTISMPEIQEDTWTATARRNLRLEKVDETESAIPEPVRPAVDLQTVRRGNYAVK